MSHETATSYSSCLVYSFILSTLKQKMYTCKLKQSIISLHMKVLRTRGGGGGYSLVDGIRGCSKILECFFVIFGILMGGFPFQTQCAQFAKLGAFWKIWSKQHPICFKLGVFCRTGICIKGTC